MKNQNLIDKVNSLIENIFHKVDTLNNELAKYKKYYDDRVAELSDGTLKVKDRNTVGKSMALNVYNLKKEEILKESIANIKKLIDDQTKEIGKENVEKLHKIARKILSGDIKIDDRSIEQKIISDKLDLVLKDSVYRK